MHVVLRKHHYFLEILKYPLFRKCFLRTEHGLKSLHLRAKTVASLRFQIDGRDLEIDTQFLVFQSPPYPLSLTLNSKDSTYTTYYTIYPQNNFGIFLAWRSDPD